MATTQQPPKAVVSWSSGKDAAFAWVEAHRLGIAEVVGLFTSVDETDGRIPIHESRASALARQVEAIGLPHVAIPLPTPCPNVVYEARLRAAFGALRDGGIRHVVLGDLFLDDIRAYRDALFADCDMTPVYPLWKRDTRVVAGQIIACGIRARIVAVDAARLDERFVGRSFDGSLLRELPSTVDPCGERGEFHTFVEDGPMMRHPVSIDAGREHPTRGETVRP